MNTCGWRLLGLIVLLVSTPAFANAAPRSALSFEPGTSASEFHGRTNDERIAVGSAGAAIVARRADGAPVTARVVFVGAQQGAAGAPEGRAEAVSHYLLGGARATRSSVPRYEAVRFPQAWPGIDVRYHAGSGRLEYDFEVAPG